MNAPIVLYSGPACPSCLEAREYLTRTGLPFREVDTTHDMPGLDELIRITHGRRVIPVITVGDQWMVGFDKQELNRMLK
jgi:glutaredoxin 3